MEIVASKRSSLARTKSAPEIDLLPNDEHLLTQHEEMKMNREALKHEEKRLVIFKGTVLLCKANMVLVRDKISENIDEKQKDLAKVKLQLTQLAKRRYQHSSDVIEAHKKRQTLLAKEKILVDKFDVLLTELASTNSGIEELSSMLEETNYSLRYIQTLKRRTLDSV